MFKYVILVTAFIMMTPRAEAAPTTFVYGLEANAGLLGVWEARPGKEVEADPVLATTFGVVPWVERSLSKGAGAGLEMGFFWVKNNAVEGDRQLILAPMPRIRMSFALSKKVSFDGFMAVGPHIWWEPTDPEAVFGFPAETNGAAEAPAYVAAAAKTRYGWGLRFGFGGGYQINRQVQAYVHFGYLYSATQGDKVTLDFQSFPFGFGLRNRF